MYTKLAARQFFGARCIYTVSQKREAQYCSSCLHQIFTDFKNSFTDTISRKFAVAVLRWGQGAQAPKSCPGPQIFGHSSSATG